MTIEEKIEKWLFNSGMFEDQAKAVMEMVKADKANEAMEGRWGDSAEGYPDVLFSVLLMSVRDAALEYIDANCPLAWFRPMFVRKKGEAR